MHVYDEVLALINELSGEPIEEIIKVISLDNKESNPDKYDDIIIYAKDYVFRVVDNRGKGGALWVYHDKENTIHALTFKEMGMKYKSGRGWWIK